jgi:hypothetical protein
MCSADSGINWIFLFREINLIPYIGGVEKSSKTKEKNSPV